MTRLEREFKTIKLMINLYCRDIHGTSGGLLCLKCEELLQYAGKRLQNCPFQEQKPTCANCSIHCYKPEMQKHIREVMRYAGPRMLWHSPYLALMHLLDDRKRVKRTADQKKISKNQDP